jgi:hypothetical protein
MAVATASGETFYTPEIERLRSEALLDAGNQTQAIATATLAVERAQDAVAIPFLQRAKAALSKIDPHERTLRFYLENGGRRDLALGLAFCGPQTEDVGHLPVRDRPTQGVTTTIWRR